jgi:hypothetical protein
MVMVGSGGGSSSSSSSSSRISCIAAMISGLGELTAIIQNYPHILSSYDADLVWNEMRYGRIVSNWKDVVVTDLKGLSQHSS